MAALGPLNFYYEVHEGDYCYRLHPAVQEELSASMTPGTLQSNEKFRELCQIGCWDLFKAGGQACHLRDPAWRIDIQSRDAARYLWAFQGPVTRTPPAPTYGVVRADRAVEKFSQRLVKGRVQSAMKKSTRDKHTWYIRVERYRKGAKRKRSKHDKIKNTGVSGLPHMLESCREHTVLQETKVRHEGIDNLYMCIEQVPGNVAMPDLSKILAGFLQMWSQIVKLGTSVETLAALASRMGSHDTVHGPADAGCGGMGATSGALIVASAWCPPLLLAGGVVGLVSAVGGLTNAVIDSWSTRQVRTQLQTHLRDIKAQLEIIEEAARTIKNDSKVESISQKIEGGQLEVVAAYLTAASALAGETSAVAACCMAVPKLSEKIVLNAATLAKLPDAVTQASTIQRTFSTASTAASTTDAVAASTSSASSAASAGSTASRVAKVGGVVSIVAGAVQLGIGINRLVNGSTTTAEIKKLCEDAQAIFKSSQDLATGCTALGACAHNVDMSALMCLVSTHMSDW